LGTCTTVQDSEEIEIRKGLISKSWVWEFDVCLLGTNCLTDLSLFMWVQRDEIKYRGKRKEFCSYNYVLKKSGWNEKKNGIYTKKNTEIEGIGLEQILALNQLFLILTRHVENWECLKIGCA
jgi:hypothetical protein